MRSYEELKGVMGTILYQKMPISSGIFIYLDKF